MQLGRSHAERNALEDTKRVLEQLRKNGTVDTLHSQALNALFQSDVFKSEVQQWLRSRAKPSDIRSDVDALQEMALSALAGLLAGTKSLQQDLQQPQQQSQSQQQQQKTQQQQQQQSQQSQSQQQLLRPGQKPPGLPQSQQQLQALTSQARKQTQQRPPISISEDVALKLQVAIIQMLENEEKQLQGCFKQHYTRKLQQLQHGQPMISLDFTAEPPKDVVQSPLSPKVVYHPEDPQHSQQ